MFDISWTKLLLIGLIAMVVMKPGDLPEAMRTLGRFIGKLKLMAADFQGQFNDAMRDAQLDDVRKVIDDVRDLKNLSPVQHIKDTITQIADETNSIGRDLANVTQLPDFSQMPDVAPPTLAKIEVAPEFVPDNQLVEAPAIDIPAAAAPMDLLPAAPAEVAQAEPVAAEPPAKMPRKRKAAVKADDEAKDQA